MESNSSDDYLALSRKYESLLMLPLAWGVIASGDYQKYSSNHTKEYWEQLSKVSRVVVTGGRYSAKSFAVGLAAAESVVSHNHRILYTRYTLVSAKDSIIPEIEEKIGLLGYHNQTASKVDRVISLSGKGKIVFRGIKPGSGTQSANLKSLKDFSCFILDEAEEMPTYADWEKIELSIRTTDIQNYSVIVLNPATKEHWVYENMFLANGVPAGFNGIKGDTLYIHTTYQDVPREFIPNHIYAKYENARIVYEKVDALTEQERETHDPQEVAIWKWFKHVVLGGWLDKAEGVIFPSWQIGEFPEHLPYGFGQDFGFSTDPDTLTKCAVDVKAKRMYWDQCIYTPGLSRDALVAAMRPHTGSELIVADSEDSRLITDLKLAGFNVQGAQKGPGSVRAGIKEMLGYTHIVTSRSTAIHSEFNNYVWSDKKSQTPIDAYNHAIDGGRYYFMKVTGLDKKQKRKRSRTV